MPSVLVRTVVIYFFAVFALRFMGKRQVGEMQLSELTTAVLLSELIASPAVDPTVPLLYGLVPLCALVSLEVLISFGVNKSSLFAKIFDNRPSFIIKEGKLCQKELKKLRFGVEELVSELRLKGVFDPSTVECAILEPGGKLSVWEKSRDSLKLAVVCDGELCPDAMRALGVDAEKISALLSQRGVTAKEVFLLCLDGKGGFYIAEKEKNK